MVVIQMINDLCSFLLILSGATIVVGLAGNGILKQTSILDQEAEQKAAKGISGVLKGAIWVVSASAIGVFFTSYM